MIFLIQRIFLILFFTVSSIGIGLYPKALAGTFQSAGEKTKLLELFSSEGCSSCPPAERWVNQLQSQSGLWRDFVPAVFHVDYWDYLGWKDRFASRQFTDRQRVYVQSWNRNSLYTPCVTLDGKAWNQWQHVRTVPQSSGKIVGVLRAESLEANRFEVSFKPDSKDLEGWQAHIALLGFGVTSKIMAGENFGKTSHHDFIVLDYKQKGFQKQSDTLSTQMDVVMPSDIKAKRYGIAVWVTHGKNPYPMQATGGYL